MNGWTATDHRQISKMKPKPKTEKPKELTKYSLIPYSWKKNVKQMNTQPIKCHNERCAFEIRVTTINENESFAAVYSLAI